MDPPPAAGNLDPAVERGRSGGGLQDAPSGGSNGAPYVSGGGAGGAPFLWPGGPPTGPLGALLAAAGVPPGMVAGAWPGGAATAAGQPPAQQPAIPAAAGLAAGAWPGIPGAWPGVPSAGPSASQASGIPNAAMPGGWPEWWAGAAAAALGPDWLRADPQQETASQEVGGNDERLPVRVTSGPVRSSSTRRRGTRAPRPPPAARTATAPASVDVDLTDPRRSRFAKHFSEWLQLHQRSCFTRAATAAAVSATATALPNRPLLNPCVILN
ncbi:elastin-like [Setaria italica]|uniref:elastin-like n=2 Tax=Setaria italica TaxID=4555 RepID=UPI000BE5FB09|nr:elastin-like [Setaria italica]